MGRNPHKQGEHVFNDVPGSLVDVITTALGVARANSLILMNRHGALSLHDFPKTHSDLRRLNEDPILVNARTVVAPATGIRNDANSKVYGTAKLELEHILSEAVLSMADLAWKKKPTSNSSFLAFERIVDRVRNTTALQVEAKFAIDNLVESAYDPQAEERALSERTSDTEIARRRAAIRAWKQHRKVLKQAGQGLVGTFFEELERVLERRIGAA